jgi:hypothetical protein
MSLFLLGPSKVKLNTKSAIIKVDEDQRLVFGWFSVIEENGQVVEDLQGDVIDEVELEKAAYDFVLNARVAGEMHKNIGVGSLIESVMFTKEKQKILGIDLGKVGWFAGFYIDDDSVWDSVKKGDYSAFSISGKAEAA